MAGAMKDEQQSKRQALAPYTEPISSNGGGVSLEAELPWPGPSRRWVSPLDFRKQIFCNRSLNMKSIVAVGFDMDYTLAQYKPDTFESLAYTGTIQKLVHDLKYPSEVRNTFSSRLHWTLLVLFPIVPFESLLILGQNI